MFDFSSFRCISCFYSFNQTRLPIKTTTCSHFICTICVQNLDPTFTCPIPDCSGTFSQKQSKTPDNEHFQQFDNACNFVKLLHCDNDNSKKINICINEECKNPRVFNCIICHLHIHKKCQKEDSFDFVRFLKNIKLDFKTVLFQIKRLQEEIKKNKLEFIGQRELMDFISGKIRKMVRLNYEFYNENQEEFELNVIEKTIINVKCPKLEKIADLVETIVKLLVLENIDETTIVFEEISKIVENKIGVKRINEPHICESNFEGSKIFGHVNCCFCDESKSTHVLLKSFHNLLVQKTKEAKFGQLTSKIFGINFENESKGIINLVEINNSSSFSKNESFSQQNPECIIANKDVLFLKNELIFFREEISLLRSEIKELKKQDLLNQNEIELLQQKIRENVAKVEKSPENNISKIENYSLKITSDEKPLMIIEKNDKIDDFEQMNRHFDNKSFGSSVQETKFIKKVQSSVENESSTHIYKTHTFENKESYQINDRKHDYLGNNSYIDKDQFQNTSENQYLIENINSILVLNPVIKRTIRPDFTNFEHLIGLSDSNFIETNNLFFINQLFPKKMKYKLIYSSFFDGNSVSVFHQKCDMKGPTLVFIKSEEWICGGFSDQNWTSESGQWKSSSKCFLFSLNKLRKYELKGQRSDAVYCDKKAGPIFGGGHDLYIGRRSGAIGDFSNAGVSYDFSVCDYPKAELFGKSSFVIDGYEVFQMNEY